MNSVRAQTYLAAVSDMFTDEAIQKIRPILLDLPDEAIYSFESFKLKNPQTSLVLSLLVGGLGVDRFYIGDISMGFLKLLLPLISILAVGISSGLCLAGFVVWASICLVDYFRIMSRTRIKNYNIFLKRITLLVINRH